MTTYELAMRDEGGSTKTCEIKAQTPTETQQQILAECFFWAMDAEWEHDGAIVRVYWTLIDEDGVNLDSGSESIMVEPGHDALIRAAGGDADCDHDWTSDGVWSTGGTSMLFAGYCRVCGLRRVDHRPGRLCDPGDHTTYKCEQPDSWCSECERAECECECEECEEYE